MPRVAALVLAAGLSSRSAPRNKLLTRDAHGVAMLASVVDAALASKAELVIVVTGHQAEAVREALAGRDAAFVHAADFASGMSASLRAGLGAVPAGVDGVLVCLGDMPLVTAAVLDRLIGAYDPREGRVVVVPLCGGRRGNPVLWDRRFFATMAAVRGDTGARALLGGIVEGVVYLDVADEGVLTDFDT